MLNLTGEASCAQGTTIGIVSQVEIDQVRAPFLEEGSRSELEHLQDLFESSEVSEEEDHHMVERCLSDYQDVPWTIEILVGQM